MFRFFRAIVFLHRQYLVQTFRWDETRRSTTEYTDECLPIVPALSQIIIKSPSSPAVQPVGKWPASALPVADAVSFEFDGVTSQDSMWQTATLMRLLAFYDQFIKCIVIVKFPRTGVFMRGQVSEKWGTNADARLPPHLAVNQRDGQRHWWWHLQLTQRAFNQSIDGISIAPHCAEWDRLLQCKVRCRYRRKRRVEVK